METKKQLEEALQLHQSGKIAEAKMLYRKVIDQIPDNHIALYFLGIIFYEENETELALEYLKKAVHINPDYSADLAKIYFKLALFSHKNNKSDKAIEYYYEVIRYKPDYTDAYLNLGHLECLRNNLEIGLKHSRKAVELNPENSFAHYNLGVALYTAKNYQTAISCYKKALSLNPDFPDAILNLGISLYRLFRTAKIDMLDEAVKCFEHVISVRPNNAYAYNNLGNICKDRYEVDKSIEYYQKAIELNPNCPDYYNNIGRAYQLKNDVEKSAYYYKKAIELAPDKAEGYFNYASILILIGEYEKGWKYYERRFELAENSPVIPEFSQPRWDGSCLKDKTLYVCYEQGYGDGIQFARYLPILNSMGAKVLYQAPKALIELMKNSDLKAEIIDPSIPIKNLEFDMYIPLLSLPDILKTTIDNIPFSEGFLKADKEKVKYFNKKYFNNDKFKIGIFWQGNNQGLTNRAMPLKYFYKLSSLENVKIYSLQKGYGAEQLQEVPKGIEIVNMDKEINDFADTAAIIENLNLMITIDTSIVHLSAGLGKPTWLLLPFAPEFRWMLNREDSPWYKSIKIYRQKETLNWGELIDRVCIELERILP